MQRMCPRGRTSATRSSSHLFYNSHVALARAVISWLELIRQRDQMIEICVDRKLIGTCLAMPLIIECRRGTSCAMWGATSRSCYGTSGAKKDLPGHHSLQDAKANRYTYRERISLTKLKEIEIDSRARLLTAFQVFPQFGRHLITT